MTVHRELLRGERLERPFAYRLSAEGAKRVNRTLKPGDYAIISREPGELERQEIYAVREPERIVLSRVFEKGPGTGRCIYAGWRDGIIDSREGGGGGQGAAVYRGEAGRTED